MIYGLHYLTFAHLNDLVAPRLVLMTGIQIVWGTRLTLNYWRKGGFEKYYSTCELFYLLTLVFTEDPKTIDGSMSGNTLPDTSRRPSNL
jgi:hypothetical protein